MSLPIIKRFFRRKFLRPVTDPKIELFWEVKEGKFLTLKLEPRRNKSPPKLVLTQERWRYSQFCSPELGKKSEKTFEHYISPLSRSGPVGPTFIFCMWGHTADVMTCFEFQIDCLSSFGANGCSKSGVSR